MSDFDLDFDIDLSGEPSAARFQPPGPIRRLLHQTTELLGTDDYVMDMDWTTLSNYLECPQKGEYNAVWSRNDGGSAALTYGRAIHKGLESYYHAHHLGQRMDWQSVIPIIEHEFEMCPINNTEWRTPEKCLDSLIAYEAKYANEPYTVFTHESSGPFIEKPFSFTVCELELNAMVPYASAQIVRDDYLNHGSLYVRKVYLNWTGVLDLALSALDDELWLMDHKTTSIVGPAYFESFRLSGQFIGYDASFKHLTGLSPRGLIGNFVIGRKPSLKGKGKPLQLERQHYTYEAWQTEKWFLNLKHWSEKFLGDLVSGYFGENPYACNGKFGLCRYFSVCQANPQDGSRHAVLHSDQFVNNVWNPLTVD